MNNYNYSGLLNSSTITNFTPKDLSNENLDDEGYIPYIDRPETYIVPVVFAIIFVIGVIGNGTLVMIFIRERSMRNITNTYLLSLAIGDLLLILTCIPFTSTLYTIEYWPYGEGICKLSESVKDISIGVSVFTLTALSAERYYATVNPIHRHVHMSTKLMTVVTTIAIWVLAIILAVPSGIFSYLQKQNITKDNNMAYCYPFPSKLGPNYPKVIIMTKFLVHYAIPLFIIGFFYTLMAARLESSTRNMPGEIVRQSSQIRARKKVAKMVLAFVIIFIICFLPYHIFMLWFHFNPNSQDLYDEYWHAFRILGFSLSFLNSCINPIALYCLSGTFRKHFNNYLCCRCTRGGVTRRSSFRRWPHNRNNIDTIGVGSSHTLVHFTSTFRRRDDLASCSVATNTTFFNFEKN